MLEQCIQVKNLSKSFSGRKVVDNLSFEVNKENESEWLTEIQVPVICSLKINDNCDIIDWLF